MSRKCPGNRFPVTSRMYTMTQQTSHRLVNR